MATTEGGLGSMVSTKETAEMERAIAALVLELPGEVWDDVKAKWHAARDSLGAEVERLALVLGARNTEAEQEWIEQNQRLRRAFDAAVAYIHGGQDRGAESQARYTAWLNARDEARD